MKPENTKKQPVDEYEDKLKRRSHGLPEKEFLNRESELTVLFENPHVKTIQHLFIALFLGLMLNTIVRDLLENNESVLGFRLIRRGFKKLPVVLLGWATQFCFMCSTYFCFTTWANVRIKFNPSKSTFKKLWDSTATLLLIGYFIFSFRLAAYIVSTFKLPPASAAIILAEQTRMLMKVYAFIRSNIPLVLMYKEKSENKLVLSKFRQFLYFTVVPTLIYKDEYPRTKTIRWKVVAVHALEIFSVILFYAFAMERFLIPLFHNFGTRRFTYGEIFLAHLETSFTGALFSLSTFYLIFHLVQNFFAEILRFGDRMFYKDWWTVTDFNTWHRKWNVMVHDWLYTYIYRDCCEYIFPGNNILAKLLTFFISAVVHEWILMHMFGYFLPVLFLMFFSTAVIFSIVKMPRNPIMNIFCLLSVFYGMGILLTSFMLEFFARYNNTSSLYEEYDFYIPRSLTCDCYA